MKSFSLFSSSFSFSLLFFAILTTDFQNSLVSASSFQSGPSTGATYAGNTFFDADNGSLYITGITYGDLDGNGGPFDNAQCFVAAIDVDNSSLQLKNPSTFGTANVDTVCSDISVWKNNDSTLHQDTLWVLGATEEGGILTDQRVTGSNKATEYGLLLDMGKVDSLSGSVQGGGLMHDSKVQYPKSMAHPNFNTVNTNDGGDYIYVASMHTESTSLNPNIDTSNDQGGINWFKQHKYGTTYSLVLERMGDDPDATGTSGSTAELTMEAKWRKPYALLATAGDAAPTLHVANILYVSNPSGESYLAVVGYTNGSGEAFGQENDDASNMNGFISLFSTSTGSFLKSIRLKGVANEASYITGSCMDEDNLYIVGSSQTQKAFMAALSLNELSDPSNTDYNPLWTYVLPTSDNVLNSQLHCVASKDLNLVYFVGSILNDGILDDERSEGGDDVFIVRLPRDYTNGDEEDWLFQIGSTGDDRATGIAMNPTNGDLYIYGDTTGSMFRDRKGAIGFSELFVMKMDMDANYDIPIGCSDFTDDDDDDWDYENPENNEHNDVNDFDDDDYVFPPDLDDYVDDTYLPDDNDDENVEKYTRMTRWSRVFGVALLLAVVHMAWKVHRDVYGHQSVRRTEVFAYAQNFDMEDIDLRPSATGGYHGTYMGPLAEGVDRRAMISDPNQNLAVARGHDEEDAQQHLPMTHSSVVKDALFMDSAVMPDPKLVDYTENDLTLTADDGLGGNVNDDDDFENVYNITNNALEDEEFDARGKELS